MYMYTGGFKQNAANFFSQIYDEGIVTGISFATSCSY